MTDREERTAVLESRGERRRGRYLAREIESRGGVFKIIRQPHALVDFC